MFVPNNDNQPIFVLDNDALLEIYMIFVNEVLRSEVNVNTIFLYYIKTISISFFLISLFSEARTIIIRITIILIAKMVYS